MKISTVAKMRDLDWTAVDRFGIKAELLMENAGLAAYGVIQNEIGVRGRSFAVFCGVGNNGGDGLVIARKIHSNGGEVRVCIVGNRKKFSGSAAMNLSMIERLSIPVSELADTASAEEIITGSDAIIDAIFGTGLTREVQGLYREVIDLINAAGKPVFSVDIPSGVNGDTGMVMWAAVKADFPVTFGLPKVGNILYPGYGLCGKLFVSHISFPPAHYDNDSLRIEVNTPPPIPPRNAEGHKGSFGDVLVVAGAAGYLGAPYFAAMSFLKAGGGYSRLAAPRSIVPHLAVRGGEIVFLPQHETVAGSISLENREDLVDLSRKVDMAILGPGLSLDVETQTLARKLTRSIEVPLLIDGDGITALCTDLQMIREREAPTILTPHLGELSRITGIGIEEIRENSIEILHKTTADLGAIIVMKGAHSLIGYPDGRVFVNLSGNAGMATAGSGDVLTGAIAAMFGLGLPLDDAVRKGVFIHGFAGDLAAEYEGEDGITAGDIMSYLPLAVKMDREGLDDSARARYEGPVPV